MHFTQSTISMIVYAYCNLRLMATVNQIIYCFPFFVYSLARGGGISCSLIHINTRYSPLGLSKGQQSYTRAFVRTLVQLTHNVTDKMTILVNGRLCAYGQKQCRLTLIQAVLNYMDMNVAYTHARALQLSQSGIIQLFSSYIFFQNVTARTRILLVFSAILKYAS